MVWELDRLCHLPAGSAREACRIAGELGHSCHRPANEGVLLVDSPFHGRQVALIVESNGSGAALGGALQELMAAVPARVNLVRTTGRPAALPLGGHLLLWLTDAPQDAPLVMVPGKYPGSTRLASLLKEELSSAARLTPGTDILFLEASRRPLPATMPAVLIECPPAPEGAVRHWAAGLKQGLARHFSGEGTSLSSGLGTRNDGDRAVQVFWERLRQTVPEARLTTAAGALFGLVGGDSPLPPAGEEVTPVKTAGTTIPPQGVIRPSRAGQLPGFTSGTLPGGRFPAGLRPPAVPPLTYPPSPYPVTYAPFQRPFGGLPKEETVPFTRSPTDIVPERDPAPEEQPPCDSPLR